MLVLVMGGWIEHLAFQGHVIGRCFDSIGVNEGRGRGSVKSQDSRGSIYGEDRWELVFNWGIEQQVHIISSPKRQLAHGREVGEKLQKMC